MSKYLVDFFYFNDNANKKLLSKIMLLTDKTGCVKLFSHLINCQYKWMARILKQPGAEAMSWWEPVYLLENLAGEWNKSFEPWPKYVLGLADDDFLHELTFARFDNEWWRATLQDIMLQLNYHSIHHRAQMQMIIRQQGLTPDPLDYILTRYKKNDV